MTKHPIIIAVTFAVMASFPPAADARPCGAMTPRPMSAWRPAIERSAATAGIDADLLEALIWVESKGDPAAVSCAGAVGLGQLMPATAAAMGVDPWQPEQNILGAARHLAVWMRQCGPTNGLAAYNGGNRACRGNWPAETAAFVPRVLAERDRIAAQRRPKTAISTWSYKPGRGGDSFGALPLSM